MVSVFAVLQVLLGAALVTLVLMHSGRDAGFGGIVFTVNTIVLYRVLA